MFGPSVAILEDESLLALELHDLCEDFGCRVLGTARTAEAGIKLISLRPDVLISDVDLGRGIDGVAFAEEMRRDDPSISIVFVTATQDPNKLSRIAALPQAYLLRKPVRSEELRRAIAGAASAGGMVVPPRPGHSIAL